MEIFFCTHQRVLIAAEIGRPCDTAENHEGFCIAVKDCPIYENYTMDLPSKRAREDIQNLAKHCSNIGLSLNKISRNTEVCCPTVHLQKTFNRIAQDVLPNQGRCIPFAVKNYIRNGALTHIYEFPWMVQIAYRNLIDNKISFGCAGSIITKTAVLTAGKSYNCLCNVSKESRISFCSFR